MLIKTPISDVKGYMMMIYNLLLFNCLSILTVLQGQLWNNANELGYNVIFFFNPKTVFWTNGQNSFDLFLENTSLDLSGTRLGSFS